MTPQEIIAKATLTARKSWEKYTLAQEVELFNVYTDATAHLTEAINSISSTGLIPSTRMLSLIEVVKKEADVIRRRIRAYITLNQRRSVIQGAEAGVAVAQVVVAKSYMAEIGVSAEAAMLPTHAMDFLLRYSPGQITLSRLVWDAVWPAERAIRHRINTAVVLGQPASSLAQDIKGYLGHPGTFELGTIDETALHLGKGVYKSPYKNALRVARTELSRAYVEGGRRYMHLKPWIKGVYHRNSGNPCTECADLEGTFYSRDETSLIPVHPHCMCYEEQVINEEALRASA